MVAEVQQLLSPKLQIPEDLRPAARRVGIAVGELRDTRDRTEMNRLKVTVDQPDGEQRDSTRTRRSFLRRSNGGGMQAKVNTVFRSLNRVLRGRTAVVHVT